MVNISAAKLRHRSGTWLQSHTSDPALQCTPRCHLNMCLCTIEIRAMWEPRCHFQGLSLLCYGKFNPRWSLKTQDCQMKAPSSTGEAFCRYTFCNSAKLWEQIAPEGRCLPSVCSNKLIHFFFFLTTFFFKKSWRKFVKGSCWGVAAVDWLIWYTPICL